MPVQAANQQLVPVTSRQTWATNLLTLIGAPATQQNVTTVVAWETAEGGAGPQFGVPNNVANYNPLNVTLTYGQQGYGYDPGTGVFYAGASPTPGNQPPVASFSDWNTGLAATAARLQEPFASNILSALKSNASEAQVAQAVSQSGWGTGDFAGSGTNATLTSATASNSGAGGTTNTATAGGGQGGAPYTPSSIPGIPSQAPSFPDFTANPYNELSRVLSWVAEFGGWAIFVLVVLLFGIVFLGLGIIMLVVLLAQPVASPIADVVTGGVIGRATKGVARGAKSSKAPVDETAGAQHVARGAHAPGAGVRSTEAVRRHKENEASEDRELRRQARSAQSVHTAHARAERTATRRRQRERTYVTRRDA